MKKILFFFLLIGVFFIGSLTANALNTNLESAYFYYLNNNQVEDAFSNWHSLVGYSTNGTEYQNVIGDSFYNDEFPVFTNALTDYYVIPNRFNMSFTLNDETFTCGSSTATITYRLKAFVLDEGGESISSQFNAYNFWQNSEFYITPNNDHNETYKCTAIADTTSNITVTCPYIGSSYNRLHFHTYNEAFKDLTTTEEEYLSTHFAISVRKNVTYECLDHPFLTLSSSVNGSTATVSVSGSDSDVIGYYYYLPGVDESEVYSANTSYTYNNLSNGTYTVYVNAVYSDGSQGTMTQTTFTISESSLPVASFTVQQNATTEENASLFIDASASYSPNYDISKYYFRLDNGQWYSSTSPIYNFVNVSFGSHYVYVRVEDSDGNLSTPTNKYISILTPYEEEKGFWESIVDFFSNFFDNLLDALVGFFIPDEAVLNSFITQLQTTFETKLGFLGDSINFIIDEFQFLIAEPTGFTGICLDPLKMPAMAGVPSYDIIEEETCLSASIMDNFSSITDVIKVVTTFTFLGWFATFAYRELHSILNGGGKE